MKFSSVDYDPSEMYFGFWAHIKRAGEDPYYEMVGTRLCTQDDFPTELQSELKAINVSSYHCSTHEEFVLYGDEYSDAFQILEVNSVYCHNDTSNDTCSDFTSTYAKYYMEHMHILISEAYYDYNDFENPVKYRLNTENKVSIDYGMVHTQNFKISESTISKVDESNSTMIGFRKTNSFSDIRKTIYTTAVKFELDSYNTLYQQYISYQPTVLTGSAESGYESQRLMSHTYNVFYIMAQLGGLYLFLSLLFGGIVNYVNYKNFMLELLNFTHRETHIKRLEEQFNQLVTVPSNNKGQNGTKDNFKSSNLMNNLKNDEIANVDNVHNRPPINQ